MASICSDFPYDVNDEPTEDWTIEQSLHWCLLRSQAMTDSKRDELISTLQKQLEDGKNNLWSAHEEAVAFTSQKKENCAVPISQGADKNMNPAVSNSPSEKQVKGKNSTRSAQTKPQIIKTVNAVVTEGMYVGSNYVLKPRARAPCFVGRSAGKKFRERGISFRNDGEVSTTHGKFEVKAGKAYFTDTGSTNGSLCDGNELECNIPMELKDGMLLQIGSNFLKITFGYD